MTCYFSGLGCAFDWLKQVSLAARPIRSTTQTWVVTRHQYGTGSLRSDDGDGNEDVKTTILHVHHAFLYNSLPSLHDYDVKMPNFTLYTGSTQATANFLPLSELGYHC